VPPPACRCIPCNGNGARGWPRYGPDEAGTECLECPGVPNGGNVTDNGTENRAVCIPGPGARWPRWSSVGVLNEHAFTPWSASDTETSEWFSGKLPVACRSEVRSTTLLACTNLQGMSPSSLVAGQDRASLAQPKRAPACSCEWNSLLSWI
jgi:hypothetical protein